jgi:two-component system, cell cycle sensor histidine kinase and response regulator CckA
MDTRTSRNLELNAKTLLSNQNVNAVCAGFEHHSSPATILLVEDEESVRTVTREVLEADGYFVLDAADAVDGIAVYDEHAGEIDLLLSDVVMPGMNGRDMARKLIDKKPDLRVIFMSGYTDTPVLREAFADCNTVYLQKPFSVETLRTRIRQVLEAHAVPSGD